MNYALSDRQRLQDELEKLEIEIAATDKWTQRISWCVMRRDEINKKLKQLGKKDWF